MAERIYIVPDISCDHCVRAVTAELTKLAGVTNVVVDLPAKRVTVQHDGTPTDAELKAAIEEAGYSVAA
jgi:copper chaperone